MKRSLLNIVAALAFTLPTTGAWMYCFYGGWVAIVTDDERVSILARHPEAMLTPPLAMPDAHALPPGHRERRHQARPTGRVDRRRRSRVPRFAVF